MLPKVQVVVRVYNPNYVKGTDSSWYTTIEVTAEVLTVHFQKNTMRIRYTDLLGKVQTGDTSAKPFFDKYEVKPL